MRTPLQRGLQRSFEIEARGGCLPTLRRNYKPGPPLGNVRTTNTLPTHALTAVRRSSHGARPWYPPIAVAKRSPILGYNHNVRYRGLIFHVQTEDSGLLSPHLFTHLFHGGVILSTRKLVYDAGAAEDAIKGLMQAQHKVVLKDLKGGKFDDKIDQYLGGTPGLLPRGEAGGAAADEDAGPSRESSRAMTEPGEPPLVEDAPQVPLSTQQ